MSTNKKLYIKTWGCQMNEYDSSKMASLLESTHGYQITEIPEEADLLLLNTCSIREKAQEKFSISLVAGNRSKIATLISLLVSAAVLRLKKVILSASAHQASILFSVHKRYTVSLK